MFRFLFIYLSLSSPFYASNCTDIKSYINQNLPLKGTLDQEENGFVYVKVSDDYLYALHPFIQNEGYSLPPYFGNNLVGAHITVIKAGELSKIIIEEIGSTIPFEVIDCEVVHPPHWNAFEKVYILRVDCSLLDAIRKKYGLPPPPFPYHITIGVK
ncbi:MAG: hypothetical protein AB7N99_04995 [Simkaniaceae bacterium]|jgi:hypothetical protein